MHGLQSNSVHSVMKVGYEEKTYFFAGRCREAYPHHDVRQQDGPAGGGHRSSELPLEKKKSRLDEVVVEQFVDLSNNLLT